MKRSEIEQLLPQIFQRSIKPGSPLLALLEVMETHHQPAEEVLDRIETYFNAYRTPDSFVFFLLRWVDLERLFHRDSAIRIDDAEYLASFSIGTGRLRELIAAAARLSQWRGTAKGLQLFLETATGVPGFELEENLSEIDGARPFHVCVRVPLVMKPHQALIEQIIEQEKPAYVTYELQFGPSGRGGK